MGLFYWCLKTRISGCYVKYANGAVSHLQIRKQVEKKRNHSGFQDSKEALWQLSSASSMCTLRTIHKKVFITRNNIFISLRTNEIFEVFFLKQIWNQCVANVATRLDGTVTLSKLVKFPTYMVMPLVLILHLQSKCQTNISLSNATFLTSPSLTKYHSSISSHVPSICYNCNALRPLQWSSGPTLLWASWPTRSSNLIDYHLVKLGHFCRALAGQKYSLMSLSKNMTECTKHGRKKTWKGILD